METVKVLFADDDYMICDTMEQLLAKEGWFPIIAHNGEEAYELYCEKRPHIVVLDVAMPVLSGIEVARKIRENDMKTSIIFYTGVSNNDTMKNILSLGVNQTLMKNFSSELLVEMVKNSVMNVTISGQIHLASNVVFEPDTKYLYVSSDSYYLPNKQAMILSELAKCINKVVRYDRLCNILWGGVNADFYSTQLRKHVSRLNVLLKDKTKLKIYNIRNSGYSLKNVEP